MRVFSLLSALFLVLSCNDIDGEFRVLNNFVLVDEDGYEVEISKGSYSAEIGYETGENFVELEIDNINGRGSRTFIIPVPEIATNDFKREYFEMGMPIGGDGSKMQANMTITNTRIYRKGPYEAYTRCRRRSALYYPSIYFKVKRRLGTEVRVSNGEETLALFEATKDIKERDVAWKGECGESMPEYEVHPGG